MNVEKDMVCRLCLQVPRQYLVIDETATQILDVLLVKINLDVSNEPLMCEDCMEVIKELLSFKSMCMDSEESILLFDTDVVNMNVDLRDVNTFNLKAIFEGKPYTCRFCIKKVEENNFVQLEDLMKDRAFSDMVKEYMFQMDLNIIKNPLICFHCRDSMDSYFKFLRKCRVTEDKVNTYQKDEGKRCDEKTVLINVFGRRNSLMEIKEEFVEEGFDSFYHNEETTDPVAMCACGTKDSSCFRCRGKLENSASDVADIQSETIPSEVKNETFKIETEELIIKSDETDLIMDEISPQQEGLKSGICAVPWNENGRILKIEIEKLIIKDRHRNINKTGICKKKRKKRLKRNSKFEMVSTTLSQKVCKCTLCPYQGVNIDTHLLTHRDVSEVQLYRCDSYEYQGKHKGDLRNHSLIHKKVSDVLTYQCDRCEYETKDLVCFKRHYLSVHKDFPEIQMYQCDSCKYQTNCKRYFTSHLSIHSETRRVRVYRCDICDYQTKEKRSLERHVLTHKDFAEVPTYQCDSCHFRTKHKKSFKKHLLGHKDVPNVETYQCASCEFQTKSKRYLISHLLIHKKIPGVRIYQCDSCEYLTKRKDTLKQHVLIHKNLSEIQTYQCDRCDYRSRYKSCLTRHFLLKHKYCPDVHTSGTS